MREWRNPRFEHEECGPTQGLCMGMQQDLKFGHGNRVEFKSSGMRVWQKPKFGDGNEAEAKVWGQK